MNSGSLALADVSATAQVGIAAWPDYTPPPEPENPAGAEPGSDKPGDDKPDEKPGETPIPEDG